MIEIRMMLHDTQELAILQTTLQTLEDRRKAWALKQEALWADGLAAHPAPAKHAEHIELTDENGGVSETVVAAVPEPEPVIYAGTPKLEITYAELEAAVRDSMKHRDFPATRAILDSVAPAGTRLGDIDKAVWPELLQKLKVVA